jgi:hypothetical protein
LIRAKIEQVSRRPRRGRNPVRPDRPDRSGRSTSHPASSAQAPTLVGSRSESRKVKMFSVASPDSTTTNTGGAADPGPHDQVVVVIGVNVPQRQEHPDCRPRKRDERWQDHSPGELPELGLLRANRVRERQPVLPRSVPHGGDDRPAGDLVDTVDVTAGELPAEARPAVDLPVVVATRRRPRTGRRRIGCVGASTSVCGGQKRRPDRGPGNGTASGITGGRGGL